MSFGCGALDRGQRQPAVSGINITGSQYFSESITLPTGVLLMHPEVTVNTPTCEKNIADHKN